MKADIEGIKKTVHRHAFPVDVVVEVIARCNLRCVMCPQPGLRRPRGEMSFETFTKIADEVAKQSPESRMWLALMGEPLLLGERLLRMIAYAKRAGVRHVNLNTNAELLTPALAAGLVEAGLDEVLIGLDALTEATYRRIRVGGDFGRVLENVDVLLAERLRRKSRTPRVVAQFIVMPENEHEAEDFKEHWLAKGAVVKLRPRLGWGVGVAAGNLDLPESERTFPCPWLTRTVSIHWSGRFAQCDADYEGEYSPGDIGTSSIKQVWEGELAPRRERHWRLDFTHELCQRCRDWQAGRSQFFHPPGEEPPR